MKKLYLIFLYYVFFIPVAIFYRVLKKSIINQAESNSEEKVVLMLNESKKYQTSFFVNLLERVVPKVGV